MATDRDRLGSDARRRSLQRTGRRRATAAGCQQQADCSQGGYGREAQSVRSVHLVPSSVAPSLAAASLAALRSPAASLPNGPPTELPAVELLTAGFLASCQRRPMAPTSPAAVGPARPSTRRMPPWIPAGNTSITTMSTSP